MQAADAIQAYNNSGIITAETIEFLVEKPFAARQILNNLYQQPNRIFAIALLEELINRRAGQNTLDGAVSIEELMAASYMVAIHQQVEDCLLVWKAKQTDFDTYCGVDFELVVFKGVNETKDFLEKQNTSEAKAALDYIGKGELKSLAEYYSLENLPYYL